MKPKLNYLLVIIFALCARLSFGQTGINITTLDTTKIPYNLKHEGKIKNVFRWKDSLGDNIVILAETGIYNSKKYKHENHGIDAELFAYHYLIANNNVKLSWKVFDYVSDCPVDIEASFINNTFQVTDLNEDGITEIWIMYKTVCHGDVSPYNVKIIMYQAKQKFAIRGRNRVLVGQDDKENKIYIGGDYKFDQAFANGPKVFLDYAKKFWQHNITKVTGE